MSCLLHINTALDVAYVGLSTREGWISERISPTQKEHASFLHPAIRELLADAGVVLADLAAIAVVAGPGSYTGLRVGLAAAKGFCYAADRPLIMVNTLEWMAAAAGRENVDLLCPMIDARRMEVFTALYDRKLECHLEPHARVLDETSFSDRLQQSTIAFFGNGAPKFRSLIMHPNARFLAIESGSKELAERCWVAFDEQRFENPETAVPFYGKDFFSPSILHDT